MKANAENAPETLGDITKCFEKTGEFFDICILDEKKREQIENLLPLGEISGNPDHSASVVTVISAASRTRFMALAIRTLRTTSSSNWVS